MKHFLVRCKAWNGKREELMEKMKKVVTGLDEVEEERNVAWILDLACRNETIARGVENLWTASPTWHMHVPIITHSDPHVF